jgi:hypothetical protein
MDKQASRPFANETPGSADRLSRAIEALQAGRPLFRGQLVEDLPEGLRHWLVETGQLSD